MWHAETDPAANRVLAERWPGVPNLGDITTVDWHTVPDVDWITAGYPCQGFSDAGKRLGAQDDRYLWPDVARAIRMLRPRYVALENVPGHVRRGFANVLNGLASFGYVGSWVCVRASDVGACHRRERLFVIAGDASRLRYGDGWPTPNPRVQTTAVGSDPAATRRDGDGGGHTVLRLLKTPTAQLAINGGAQHPDKRRAGGHGPTLADEIERLVMNIPIRETLPPTPLLPTPTASPYGFNQSPSPGAAIRPSLETLARLLPTPRGSDGEKGSPNQHGSSGDLMLSSAVQPGRWGQYGAAVARWEKVVGRAAPSAVERWPGGQPVLSPRFVEFLMGLPDGWVTRIPRMSRNDALRILGNGVVPQQAAYAIRLLLARHISAVAAS